MDKVINQSSVRRKLSSDHHFDNSSVCFMRNSQAYGKHQKTTRKFGYATESHYQKSAKHGGRIYSSSLVAQVWSYLFPPKPNKLSSYTSTRIRVQETHFPRKRSVAGLVLLLLAVYGIVVLILFSRAPKVTDHPDKRAETKPHNLPREEKPYVALTPHAFVPDIKNRKFKERKEIGLVHFSAYQTGEAEFRAVSLSEFARRRGRQLGGCTWEYPNGSTVEGKLTDTYPGEHHSKKYETVVYWCDLNRKVDQRDGGILSLMVDNEDSSIFSSQEGSPSWMPVQSFPYHLVYCGSPMYGSLEAKAINEWLRFHENTHQIEYFHLYDSGGIDDSILSILKPYLRSGKMDITEMSDNLKYDTWLYCQVVVVNDCALRVRYRSQWAIMMDVDEYLHDFDSSEQWHVERMIFHEPEVHCRDPTKYKSRELCLKWDGHRKYAINPRRVNLLQIHRIMNPYLGGLDAHTSVIRLSHFRGLAVRNISICSEIVTYPNPAPKNFIRDFTVARTALVARRKS